MRIISGTFKGHTLISPPGGEKVTRPITDRAKQSLFDALQDCFAVVDPVTHTAGTVLDCFAGTGSMGLECLSRGAAHAIFIERDRHALAALKQNLAAMNFTARATILPVDAYARFNADLRSQHPEIPPLTVAFVDPPYSHTDTGHQRHKVDDLLRALAAHAMVDGGIISFRHPTRVSVDAAALSVRILRELRYGEMAITWLTKAS
jgi:16S rRNA (guanine(966)-N(2))-methyltransferase RsmD